MDKNERPVAGSISAQVVDFFIVFLLRKFISLIKMCNSTFSINSIKLIAIRIYISCRVNFHFSIYIIILNHNFMNHYQASDAVNHENTYYHVT